MTIPHFAFLVSTNNWQDGVDWYLHVMFHGAEENNSIGADGFRAGPARLVVNDYLRRMLVCPVYDYFISGEIEAALAGLPNVALEPVRNLKVIRKTYAFGKRSYFEGAYYRTDPIAHTPDQFLRSLPAVEPSPAVRYSRLVVQNTHVIGKGSTVSATSRIHTSLGNDEEIDLPLDQELLISHPILESMHGLILREDVLARLAPHLPAPFFRVQPLNVA